jgi:CelD/BcsL family acetyltransferase involved in cellulose biosynthesis
MQHSIEPITETLQGEWDALADRQRALPWLRQEWVLAWARGFGGMPDAHTVREGGRLVAVVPLCSRRGAWLSPTNWHTPEFGAVAASPEAARALAEGVLRSTRRRVDLGFVDIGDPLVAALPDAAAARGFRLRRRELQRSPFLHLDGDWTTYEASLSGNLRHDVKRRLRRLHEAGEVSVELIAPAPDGELDALLDEGFRVEAAGWKGERGTAMGSALATDAFYRAVARWAAGRGWLRLAFLRLDGRAIAFQYALEADGVYSYLKGGYDEAFERFAPSKLLVRETLERLWAGGTRTFDFLGTEMPWKTVWATDARPRLLVQAFAPGPLGRADELAQVQARPAVGRLLATRPTRLRARRP